MLIAISGCAEPQSDLFGGSFGQGLQVSPTASVSTATYAITGPGDFASAGSVPVGDSPDVTVVVAHLPIGQGYELDVSGTASDGVTVCEGNTTFDVTDGSATLTLMVHLVCAVPSGDVSLQASLNICPVMDGLDALPTSLKLGGVSHLTVTAHDSDNQPAALAYAWSVNGVKLPHQNAPTLSFVCSSAGQVNLAASVSDGDPDPACADSLSVTVSCQ